MFYKDGIVTLLYPKTIEILLLTKLNNIEYKTIVNSSPREITPNISVEKVTTRKESPDRVLVEVGLGS